MVKKNILVLNKNLEEIEHLNRLCQSSGSVFHSTELEKAIPLLESIPFNVLVVEYSLAHYSFLKGVSKKTTSIVITGDEEKKIKEAIEKWPSDLYVDYHITPLQKEDEEGFLRALNRATEYSTLQIEVERLSRASKQTEMELKKETYSKIKEIKNFVSESFVKQLEKRISLEKKHISFQIEGQKIESILRKLYGTRDVTDLLDILHDIRDIVSAESISMYILDESKIQGKYLKPLVWDNTFLSYPDLSKFIVLIDSQDLAATVARSGKEINIADLSLKKEMSKRYAEKLKNPAKNLLCVPIVYEKKVIGILEIYNKIHEEPEKEGFAEDDLRILLRLAEHLAVEMKKSNLIEYDALTGLLLPDPFFDKVVQKLRPYSKRRREEESYAIVLGDIDWFKHYNERNGYEAGNKLLRELASILKPQIRKEDLLSRFGGEEFLLFLFGIKDIEEALRLTERIRKSVEDHYFEHQEFQPGNNLTMSFGVSHFTRKDFDSLKSITLDDLKKIANEAEMALSRSKGKRMPARGPQIDDEPAPVKNTICAHYRIELEETDKTGLIKPYKDKHFRERRKFERYYTPTVLIYKTKNVHNVTKTINLSLEGARISTQTKFPFNQSLDLILILGNKACHLKGKVIYSERGEGESPQYNSGLKFKKFFSSDRNILEEYFSSLSKH